MYVARDAGLFYRLVQRVLWGVLSVCCTHLHCDRARERTADWPGHRLPEPSSHARHPARRHLHSPPRRPSWRPTSGKEAGRLGDGARSTHVIYVARGEPDREALAASLKVLKAGGSLPWRRKAPAPGNPACRRVMTAPPTWPAARVRPIVPVAVWGHEKAFAAGGGCAAADVHVVLCKPIVLPPEAARAHGRSCTATHGRS